MFVFPKYNLIVFIRKNLVTFGIEILREKLHALTKIPHIKIPSIPIALGLSYNYVSLSAESNDLDIDKITGDELGAEIYAWLPFGDLQPYIKLGYVFYGKYDIPLNEVDINYKADGFYGFLGLKYSIIPMFKLLLEGGMPATGTNDASVSNNSFTPDSNFLKISAWSIRAGLEFGI